MRQTPKSKKKSRGGLCGVIVAIALIAIVASIFSGHNNASPSTDQSTATAMSDQLTATANAAQVAATNVALETSGSASTVTLPTSTVDTSSPTPQPAHQVTPLPTHQATPRPTPKPTQPPACQATNGNPWCYNFSPGNLITNPPSNFCSYFNCIASFVSADDPDGGYIVECGDTTFSQSGGESGACSHHGGELRPLYSH